MAMSNDQKIDYLFKKVGFGATKTDVNSVKLAANESISSPLLLRGDKVLQQASGRHYMMGDQISYHPAWQEGAVSSAHFTINEIDKREQANRVTSL